MSSSLDFNDLVKRIDQWGEESKITSNGTPQSEYVNLIEAFAEILETKTTASVKLGIGHCMIITVIIAKMKGQSITKQVPGFARGWPALTSNTVIALGKLSKALHTRDIYNLQEMIDDVVALLTIWATNHLLDIEECMDAAYHKITAYQATPSQLSRLSPISNPVSPGAIADMYLGNNKP